MGPEWEWWKAQLYQESRLDPYAESPVGAKGIAQFMPATWREVTQQLGIPGAHPTTASLAIDAGAFYMARMQRGWSAPRPFMDRHNLAMASYNAGFGNILKAQERCMGVNLYSEIMACLPCITGHHSRETITYVQRIAQWRALLH